MKFLACLICLMIVSASCKSTGTDNSQTFSAAQKSTQGAEEDKAVNAEIKDWINLTKDGHSDFEKTPGYDVNLMDLAFKSYLGCASLFFGRNLEDQRHDLLKATSKWHIMKIVQKGDIGIVLGSRVYVKDDGTIMTDENVGLNYVLAFDLKHNLKNPDPCSVALQSKDGSFQTPSFARPRSVVNLPKSIKVGLGYAPNLPEVDAKEKGFFYAEFNDVENVEQVISSIYSGQDYNGYSASFAKQANDKLDWDPIQNRKWHTLNNNYSMSRGPSPEAYDMYASEIDDGDYEKVVAGCNYHAAPWATGAINHVVLDGKIVFLTNKRDQSTP